ncbi:MAG: hypothetical protein IPH84_19920 [Bacteroidales bacterium]|nr:hypothetical protein [Bacteroidales bacterium]
MSCTTIEEVIAELDKIIKQSVFDNDTYGIFAYIYRRTTAEIRDNIVKGVFNDNRRMEEFDVVFANFYLEAYQNFRMNRLCSKCWNIAFSARHDQLSIVQHIMLGMNAHINLDLGVTAGMVMNGQDLEDIKEDFMKVNDILASIVDELQHNLGKVSRAMFLLDWFGKRHDENIINFSMAEARKQSWRTAQAIALTEGTMRINAIREVDELTSILAHQIRVPSSRFLRFLLRLVRRFEVKDTRLVLQGIQS